MKPLFNNNLKPLPELTVNETHVRKIWEYVTKDYGKPPITRVDHQEDCIMIENQNGEFFRRLFIHYDGCFFHCFFKGVKNENDKNNELIGNVFALVDFVRHLGYEPY